MSQIGTTHILLFPVIHSIVVTIKLYIKLYMLFFPVQSSRGGKQATSRVCKEFVCVVFFHFPFLSFLFSVTCNGNQDNKYILTIHEVRQIVFQNILVNISLSTSCFKIKYFA